MVLYVLPCLLESHEKTLCKSECFAAFCSQFMLKNLFYMNQVADDRQWWNLILWSCNGHWNVWSSFIERRAACRIHNLGWLLAGRFVCVLLPTSHCCSLIPKGIGLSLPFSSLLQLSSTTLESGTMQHVTHIFQITFLKRSCLVRFIQKKREQC